MDIVDQSVYLCAVGKTYVNHFTEYSEGTFLCLDPPRQNRVKMLQNFGDGDVDVCVNPVDPDCAVCAREPTRHCDCKLPWFALSNCGRRGFFRRQFYGTCCYAVDHCKQCTCKEKQFYSHAVDPIRRRPNPKKILRSLVPHDLGALEAKAGHQTLLIEREGVDAAMHCVRSEAAGHPFVHDDDAWASANFPAARVVYPIHRLLVH